MVEINFEKGDGLVPAIAQDCATNEVLMMAYMNRESFERTLETGTATYWSRSRKALWMKGESSGNVQVVKEIFLDCDNDTLLLRVEQIGGAACHTGYKTCFHKKVETTGITIVGEKIFNPEDVYR